MEEPRAAKQATQHPRSLDGWALGLAVLSVLAQGHRFGVGNQEFVLLRLRRMADASFLAQDWTLSLPAHHPLATGALFGASRVLGEWGALFGAHLLARVVLFAAIARLALALLPGARWGAVAAMAVAMAEPRIDLGRHFLQGGHFEPAFLGMALGVWTLAEVVRWTRGGSPAWRVGLAAGLASLVHLFIGLPLLAFALIAMAAERRAGFARAGAIAGRMSRRGRCRSWAGFARAGAIAGGVALAVGAPSIIPAAIGFLRPADGALPPDLLIAVLQVRHPHHHAPWTWGWTGFAVAAIAGASMLAILWRAGAPWRIPALFAGFYAATCAAFAACASAQAFPGVLYFQSFRLWGLLWALFAVAVGCGAERLLASRLPAWSAVARHWRIALAVGLAGIAVVHLLALRGAGPQDRHWMVRTGPGKSPERLLLARAVEDAVPRDAVVHAPLALAEFRLRAERATTVDWKEVPYGAAELAEWARRVAIAAGRFDEAESIDGLRAVFGAWRAAPRPDRAVFEAEAALAREDRLEAAQRLGAAWAVVPDGARRWAVAPVAED